MCRQGIALCDKIFHRNSQSFRCRIISFQSKIINLNMYIQLSPCGHPAITDTPIIRTADKFRSKINYRHLTEINSRYYGLQLQKTLTQGPTVSAIKGVDCTYLNIDFIDRLKKKPDGFHVVLSLPWLHLGIIYT